MLELLAVYGVCFGLMNDKVVLVRLARRIGFVDRMLDCPYCTGFHSGWLVRLGGDLAAGTATFSVSQASSLVLWGFAGAAFCYVLDTFASKLDAAPEGAGES